MKKNYARLILDILMALVFVLLFNHRILGGMAFHEIAGLTLGLAFIIHLIFNRAWIHKVTAALFGKGVPAKTRISWILDLVLVIDMFLMILCGIGISKFLVPDLIPDGGFFNKGTHVALAHIALILMGLHLGLHWDWVMATVKKVLPLHKASGTDAAGRWAARILALAIVIYGIYGISSNNFFGKIGQIAGSGAEGGQHMEQSFSAGTGSTGAAVTDSSAAVSAETTAATTAAGTEIAAETTAATTAAGTEIAAETSAAGTEIAAASAADSTSAGSGNGQGTGSGQGMGYGQGMGGNMPSASPFSVASTYLSIMSVFIAASYYLDKLLRRKKK